MMKTLLTLLLSLQMTTSLPPISVPQKMTFRPTDGVRTEKVWWGLIDPEMALWFARLPGKTEEPILWDWSWQGFFSAFLPQPVVKEAEHAPSV